MHCVCACVYEHANSKKETEENRIIPNKSYMRQTPVWSVATEAGSRDEECSDQCPLSIHNGPVKVCGLSGDVCRCPSSTQTKQDLICKGGVRILIYLKMLTRKGCMQIKATIFRFFFCKTFWKLWCRFVVVPRHKTLQSFRFSNEHLMLHMTGDPVRVWKRKIKLKLWVKNADGLLLLCQTLLRCFN